MFAAGNNKSRDKSLFWYGGLTFLRLQPPLQYIKRKTITRYARVSTFNSTE